MYMAHILFLWEYGALANLLNEGGMNEWVQVLYSLASTLLSGLVSPYFHSSAWHHSAMLTLLGASCVRAFVPFPSACQQLVFSFRTRRKISSFFLKALPTFPGLVLPKTQNIL